MKSITLRANGGLSVVSAFATGKGGACSVDLPMEVTVSMSHGVTQQDGIRNIIEFLAERKIARGNYSVSITSMIPEANGLKSSSALVLSVIYGILKLEGISMSDADLLEISAEASIANGTSVTGAVDDLAACLYGGYCLTDNREHIVKRRGKLGNQSVIIVPRRERKILSSTIRIAPSGNLQDCFLRAYSMAENGNIYGAMEMNGFIMGAYTGIDFAGIGSLLRRGALYASQSGKGPALFAIFPASELIDPMGFGDCIFTHFADEGIQVVKEH